MMPHSYPKAGTRPRANLGAVGGDITGETKEKKTEPEQVMLVPHKWGEQGTLKHRNNSQLSSTPPSPLLELGFVVTPNILF